MVKFIFKERYNVEDLIEIVRILRSPGGCPWDKVQTHESIRKDFIEEVYEAAEAIDEKDSEHLREELGDVLLQVVFHTVLEEEKGGFVFEDVTDEICKKMIIRHPHVFGDVEADTAEQVLRNWDDIKMRTHSQKTVSEAMDGVSKTLPSLMRAEKLCKKAKKGGVYPENEDAAFDNVQARLDALRKAYESNDGELCRKELGELLFSVAGLSEYMDSDCEKLLYDTCEGFIGSFRKYEEAAIRKGIDIQGSDAKAASQIWKEISK